MSVVYINSEEVCVSDDKFTKMYYNATKDIINYNQLMRAVQGHGKPIVIINSDLIFSEYKAFITGLGKAERASIIEKKVDSPNSVCANVNGLFANGKSADHQNDVIITQINYEDQESHIRTCLQKLAQSNLDLHGVYSYIQALHSIELQYSKINTSINIHVIIVGNKAVLTVSNTTYFMFGRVISKREGEDLMTTITKLLATTIKFIGTTYSFLHNPMNITIMSNEKVDTSGIAGTDPVFDDVQILFQQINLPVVAFASDVPNIANDLALIRLAMPKIGKVNPMNNLLLTAQRKMYSLIKKLRMLASIFVMCAIGYAGYMVYMTYYLDQESIRTEREFSIVNNNYNSSVNKIKDRKMDIYNNIALSTEKNTKFLNIHESVFRKLANMFNRYHETILVEGFDFKCENCDQENATYKANVQIAINNPQKTITAPSAMMQTIQSDVLSLFGKSFNDIKINFPTFSSDNKKLASNPARDTVEITLKQSDGKKLDNNKKADTKKK